MNVNTARQFPVEKICGTSLVVHPAEGLVDYYIGSRLVLINEQATPYDKRADSIMADKIGQVFSKV